MIRKILISLIFAIAMACGVGAARAADSTDCRRALATGILGLIQGASADEPLNITSDSFVKIFAQSINACRAYLVARTSPAEDIHINDSILVMNVNWDYVKTNVAAELTQSSNKRTLFLCEDDTAITATVSALTSIIPFYQLSYLAYKNMPTDSPLNKCLGTSRNTGCYTTCGENLANPRDDLNTKVFQNVFGRNLCVDEDTYILREITPGVPKPGNSFITTDAQWTHATDIIRKNVADQGNCDWHMNNIDIYVGKPLFDPITLQQASDVSANPYIFDVIRIDD